MISATNAGNTVSYSHNGLDQRVQKQGPAAIVATGSNSYVYDEAGHLIGEYDANGQVIEETVYLGDLPVAVLKQTVTGTGANQTTATNVYYVYADHINTPRVITQATDNQMVWRWDNADPFGLQPPDENPSGLGAFMYNQRFPGQLYDKETNNFYNYYRDYDPQQGRYVESDPIGITRNYDIPELDVAISLGLPVITEAQGLNHLYGYVDQNPLSYMDSFGLAGNGGVGNSSGIGTNTPYKHCREDPKDPNYIICKDPNGKKVRKKKPADWPKETKKEMCGPICQNVVGGIIVGGLIVGGMCIAGPPGAAIGGAIGLSAQ
ncbi:RHS repeat domain-containing protein [Paraherbaspirillum soli]|uniref:RHS repeat domain-containing protein n=1 Tax=Paraherbaspirillum soli TaxID=631222 RepID=A0ABW0MCE8_9BURK